MPTRRDILTGIATLSVAGSIPATACASTTPKPASAPHFVNQADKAMFDQLALLERLTASMKSLLVEANVVHPMARSSALMELRVAHSITEGVLMTIKNQTMRQREEGVRAVTAWLNSQDAS